MTIDKLRAERDAAWDSYVAWLSYDVPEAHAALEHWRKCEAKVFLVELALESGTAAGDDTFARRFGSHVKT